VSGGDDGQTKLWALTANGKRTSNINGKTLETNRSSISAVDIQLIGKDIVTISGTTEGRILGQKTERLFNLGCDVK
jgi:hypothetical protein